MCHITKNTHTNIYKCVNKQNKRTLKNEYFWFRLLILLLNFALFLVSVTYAIGQVTSLQLKDFWCPYYTVGCVTHSFLFAKKKNFFFFPYFGGFFFENYSTHKF